MTTLITLPFLIRPLRNTLFRPFYSVAKQNLDVKHIEISSAIFVNKARSKTRFSLVVYHDFVIAIVGYSVVSSAKIFSLP